MRDFFHSNPKNRVSLKVFRQKSQHSSYQLTVLKSIIANVPDFINYISCLRVELTRFPYQNECVNEWFKLTKKDDKRQRVVQAINIKWIKRNKTIYPPQSDVEFPLGLHDLDHKIFFHGTNHVAAKSILEGGIDLTKDGAHNDFSSRNGFYLSSNFKEAFQWACSRSANPAVIVFRIRLETIKPDTGLDLQDKPGKWDEIVSSFRVRKEENEEKEIRKKSKLSKSNSKKYKFIEGPMASVSKTVKYPKQREGSYQFCILSEELAEEFDTCLHSIVFSAKK